MNISARVTEERVLDVRFDEASVIVDLMDGRTNSFLSANVLMRVFAWRSSPISESW